MVSTRPQIKRSQQQPGALISSCDDLLIEILLRLPVTSVFQFKSVSKHWRSLLSNPPFTLLYKKHSNSLGIFANDFYIPFDDHNQSPPPFRTLDFYPDRHGIKIIQSCNGLLLCCSKNGIQRDFKYYIFNPTTRQFALIPSVPGGGNVRRTICYMGLAFHPTDFVHYKLVCFRYINRNEHLLQIQIYSSETGKWKISNTTIAAPYYAEFQGVYCHQAINLFSRCCRPYYLKLDTEEIKSLPLPVEEASSREGYQPLYFGESRGHLHSVHFFFLNLDVYEMLGDHSGWFLRYRVKRYEAYPEIICRNPGAFSVLDVVRGEEETETIMVFRILTKIIRYNVLEKSCKLMFDLNSYGHHEFHRYIQTIVSF